MNATIDPSLRFLGAHAELLVTLTHLSLFAKTVELLTEEQQMINAGRFLEPLSSGFAEHHADEEKLLFPNMLRLAKGAELDLVVSLSNRLTREHRAIETAWSRIEPTLITLTQTAGTPLDPLACTDLLERYRQHAKFEETVVLPLADRLFGDSGEFLDGQSGRFRHRIDNLPFYI
ncbi:MAG: hemerythrin domain-containing protein [Burkholderiaceae bacterium]